MVDQGNVIASTWELCERNAVRNSSTLCINNEIDGICMIPDIVCRAATVDGINVLWCRKLLDVLLNNSRYENILC